MGVKYRTKPVIIEAEQWFPEIRIDGVHLLSELSLNHQAFRELNKVFLGQNVPLNTIGWVDAPDGGHLIEPGDWVVTWINNQKYPVKQKEFQEAFEQYSDIVEKVNEH
jgi:hypothetical protein